MLLRRSCTEDQVKIDRLVKTLEKTVHWSAKGVQKSIDRAA